jgi:hypothetical protein
MGLRSLEYVRQISLKLLLVNLISRRTLLYRSFLGVVRVVPKGTYSRINSGRVSIISPRLGPKDRLLGRHEYPLFFKGPSTI